MGLEICGEPQDARSAIELAVRERPQVGLIAEGLRGGAIAAVDAIDRRLRDTKLIVLT